MTEGRAIRVAFVDREFSGAEAVTWAMGNVEGIEPVGAFRDVSGLLESGVLDRTDVLMAEGATWEGSTLEDTVVQIKALRARHPEVPVLMFARFADVAGAAMSAGAVGYVSKAESFDVMVDAVRRVAAGEQNVFGPLGPQGNGDTLARE